MTGRVEVRVTKMEMRQQLEEEQSKPIILAVWRDETGVYHGNDQCKYTEEELQQTSSIVIVRAGRDYW